VNFKRKRLHQSCAAAFKLEQKNAWTILASEELSDFVGPLFTRTCELWFTSKSREQLQSFSPSLTTSCARHPLYRRSQHALWRVF